VFEDNICVCKVATITSVLVTHFPDETGVAGSL